MRKSFLKSPGGTIMQKLFTIGLALLLSSHAFGAGILIDHNDTDITALSQADIQQAKDTLHIA